MASPRPEAALVHVRVQPRAARDEIVAWEGDALRMRVSAPPVEGEANAAAAKVLARALGVAPSTVAVVRGERSRDKVLRVAGLSLDAVRARLGAVGLALLVLLAAAAPAAADHLTFDLGARPLAPRPFDADLDVRVDRDGFRIGGRVLGFGQPFGAWLQGRFRERGLTLEGQLQGDRTYNLHLDADIESGAPSLSIRITPGTL
jgi:uncharacterized protein (TIGR00251 family)